MSLLEIPEVRGLDSLRGTVRIPPETDVPVTPRVRALLDAAPFRRLSRVSQVGLVSLVYPGATHTRFEHSLGVYRLALLFLKQLASDSKFAATVDERAGTLLIVSALLHDLGHWPYCHPLEDLRLLGVPEHEDRAGELLRQSELAEILERDWGVAADEVAELLSGQPREPERRLLQSLLSGPIDVDKMDYLDRDSLHAGVPYGRHFDRGRIIGSLCLSRDGSALGITDKGRTAAEMMVFARYVMFSEVYWHHAVRAATAMLQRAFFELRDRLDLPALFESSDQQFAATLVTAADGTAAQPLADGLFGPRRRLFKRVAQWSALESPELFARLARRPYPWLVGCCRRLAARLSREIGQSIAPESLLLDAPPVGLEVQFHVDVHFRKADDYRTLAEVSPVVSALVQRQFDDYVKRVRLFARADMRERLIELPAATLEQAVESAITDAET